MKKSWVILLLCVTMVGMFMMGGASAEDYYYVNTSNHKSVNMRAGMSTNDPVITTIPYGAKVGMIGICDDPAWASVYYGDNNGYVMLRYLSRQKPSSSSSSSGSSTSTAAGNAVSYSSFTDADYYVTVTPSTPTGHVNLRWGPSKSTDIHGMYYQGDQLRVIAETSTWAQVLDEDTLTCGFMLKSFLQ